MTGLDLEFSCDCVSAVCLPSFSFDTPPFTVRQGELKTATAVRTVCRTYLPASGCCPPRSCSSPRTSHRRLPMTLTWMTPVPSHQSHHDPGHQSHHGPAATPAPHLLRLPHVLPKPPIQPPRTPLQALRTRLSESELRSPRCPRPSQKPGASAKVDPLGPGKHKRIEAPTMLKARVTLGAQVRLELSMLSGFPPASHPGLSGRGAVACPGPAA